MKDVGSLALVSWSLISVRSLWVFFNAEGGPVLDSCPEG
jgi:hypothetical protein